MGWLWLSLALYLSQDACAYYVGGVERGGSCTYNFQVWEPDQDLLQAVHNLESKISNASLYSHNQYLQLHNEILQLHNSHLNVTAHVQHQLSQYRQHDAELALTLKNLEVETDSKVSGIWAQLNRIHIPSGGGRPAIGVSSGSSDASNQRQAQLISWVNNLRADWLIIKRNIHRFDVKMIDIAGQVEGINTSIGVMNGTIESLMESMQEMRDRYSSVQQRIDALQARAGSRVEEPPAFNRVTLRHNHDTDVTALVEELRGKMDTLSERVDKLQDGQQYATPSAPTSTHPIVKLALDTKQPKPFPTDCHDVYESGHHVSAMYSVQVHSRAALDHVYCEMINETGWLLIQRRETGQLDFDRTWIEYKLGFGGLYGEFWWGNEKLHRLTSQGQYSLRVDLWDWEGERFYAHYDTFNIDSETHKYRLIVDGYSGNAGDSLRAHDGMAFSTRDQDNDMHMNSCALDSRSGWWFKSCKQSNLNGLYQTGWHHDEAGGITWFTLQNSDFYSPRRVEMKIRPRD